MSAFSYSLDLGVFIAAIAAVLGYLYRTGFERRACAKALIYHLLEVRHSIGQMTIGPEAHMNALQRLLDQSMEGFPSVVKDPVKNDLQSPVLQQFLQDLFVRNNSLNDSNYLEQLHLKLESYAQHEPIHAYSLRGKHKIAVLPDFFRRVQEGTEVDLPAGEAASELVKNTMAARRREVFTDALEEIEKDLELVARSVGWFYSQKLKKFLKQSPSVVVEVIDDEIEEMLQEVILLVCNKLMVNEEHEGTGVVTEDNLQEFLADVRSQLDKAQG